MNEAARLAKLEQQMAALLANDHVRRALDGPQVVPLVNDPQPQIDTVRTTLARLLNNQSIALALTGSSVTPLTTGSVALTQLTSDVGAFATANAVVTGFVSAQISGGVLSWTPEQFAQVYALRPYATTDPVDLNSISAAGIGTVLVLQGQTGKTVNVKDSTGNLWLAGDRALAAEANTLTLVSDGEHWLEIARSTNA